MATTIRRIAVGAALAVALAACGGDDGATVRNIGETEGATGTGTGTATGTGTGSATGTGTESATGTTGSATGTTASPAAGE